MIYIFHSDHYEIKFGKPRVTIAGEFDKEAKTLYLAASRCSLKDNFSRKEGREKALARLQGGFYFAQISLNKCSRSTFNEVAAELEHLLQTQWENIDRTKFPKVEKR